MQKKNQVTYEQALAIAQKHHQAGNLTLADRTYRDILNIFPNDFNSLHYLSIISYQRNNVDEGLEFIERAIAEKDDKADSWNAYGVMLAHANKSDEAIQAWQKAIKLKPNYHEAFSNLGAKFWELGRFDESLKACQSSVDAKPDYADGYINLGNAYTGMGDIQKAIEVWKKSIELNPLNANPYINIGNALRDLGRLKESIEYCEKALTYSPDHPKALLNLANAKRDLGFHKEAEALYRKAIDAAPDFIDAHNNLSITLMDMLRFDAAITSIKFALVLNPKASQPYINLATALRETGKLKEAEEAARKALLLNPDSNEAKIELADILFLSDRWEEAETLFNDMIEESADSALIYLKLSNVLERSNRIEEALECIVKAVALAPEMPEVYHRQAMIYFVSNQIDKALTALDRALEIKPKFAAALATKSEILQTKGDMKEAEAVALKGLEINPYLSSLYYTLSKVKKFTADDPIIEKMEDLVANIQKYGRAQAIAIHFALFKVYEDIGDYDRAFKHLKLGGDIKRSCIVFDRQAQKESFDKIKEVFTPQLMKSFEGTGTKDETPIFIVGMPRSGTTLTEQIISSHPDVFGAGELPFLSDVENHLGHLTPENSKEFGDYYIKQTRELTEESKKARLITDKMPGNFSRIGQIIATMPNAKIIHCRRNPIDTCLSCYKQLFARGQYWSYNLEELAEYYALYEDLMDYWRETLPGKFLEIDYETTVGDFENQARKLIDFVGLEWDEACLSPHKQKRAILTASKGQVRKPVYKTSVEAWKRYEKDLGPLVEPLQKFVRKT